MCNREPIVSVVMAVYNAGCREVLDMAVEAIQCQSLDRWELIICDDASTDSTAAWLAEWMEREPRIRVLHNERNMKAAASRNRCIQVARGNFVAIMDADDACAPDRLACQLHFLQTHPEYAFVGLKGQMFQKMPGDLEKSYWFLPSPQPRDFRMTLPFVHGSLMFRREALLSVGGYEADWRNTRSEDYDLLLRMYAKGMRGANLQTTVYFIREDANTYRRRKYRYRWLEAWVKLKGFARLKLMPGALPYALKPLIVGLIPPGLLEKMKKRYYG